MKKVFLTTRDKIIYKTIEIVAKEGLNHATAGNIANGAGIYKSNIFYYFNSIDQLLSEALILCIKKVSPILKNDFSNFKSIGEYLNFHIGQLVSDSENIIYLKVILSFAHQNLYLEDDLRDLRFIIIDQLYEVLIEAIEFFRKRKLAKEEIESLGSLIMTTFNGLGVILLIDGSNEKFLRNWKLQTSLIGQYIEK